MYPRWDFIRLLKQYRGQFSSKAGVAAAAAEARVVDRACSKCAKAEPEPGAHKACARCGVARYCSRECQTAHWKKQGGDHKAACVPKPVEAEQGLEGFRPLEPGERAEAVSLLGVAAVNM